MGHPTFDVGVLGATGIVGQHFVALLANHPWFRITFLAASERSVSRRYADLPWRLSSPLPEPVGRLNVEAAQPGAAPQLVFSALPASVAGMIESAFAGAGHVVFSNARSHRMDPCVPLLVPEINPDHLGLVAAQRRDTGSRGAIITNPNCSTVFLALALAAVRRFNPTHALVTTLQAASGAGYPGVPALDLLANVIPGIPDEESKIETETRKILGRLDGDRIVPHSVTISAHTTRVPVADGHTETVSVKFDRAVGCEEVREAFTTFSGRPQEESLPSAPRQPIVVHDEPDRPQPRLDIGPNNGMSIHVGRLRPCPVLDCKFVVLGHNTIRGAAGASILNAELMAATGLLD